MLWVATISVPIILVISVDEYSGIYMHQPSWWLGAKSVLHQQLGFKVEEIQPLILESVHVVLPRQIQQLGVMVASLEF